MTTIVLIEAHPLMRLGLHQMLSRAETSWDIVALDPHDIVSYDAKGKPVTMALLGLPSGSEGVWPLVQEIQDRLRPEHTLLLADDCPPRQFPAKDSVGRVFGCIQKTVSFEGLDAAIRLGLAGGECFPKVTYQGNFEADATAAARAFTSTASSRKPELSPVSEHLYRGYRNVNTPADANTYNTAVRQPVFSMESNKQRAESDLVAEFTERDRFEMLKGARLLDITPRQYEVLLLLARGYPLKTVSRILNISTATAKAHASTLYQRLHVNSKGEAVFAARQRGAQLD